MKYFNYIDFYNIDKSTYKINGKILSEFKTIQQTTDYTCGPCAVLMVMNYYGENQYTENGLCKLFGTKEYPIGTDFEDLLTGIQKMGYTTYSSRDMQRNDDGMLFNDYLDFREFLLNSLDNGEPIIVDWTDYGGHYKVIIGLDMVSENPGEDIIIFADSSDCSDGRVDGYNYFPADRFFYMWFAHSSRNETDKNQPFVIIKRPTVYQVKQSECVSRTDKIEYYRHYDFYNLTKTDLNINGELLTKFSTKQQQTEYTCGPSCIEMVLNYYGDYRYNEERLAIMAGTLGFPYGTKLGNMITCIHQAGYETYSAQDIKRDSNGKCFSNYINFREFVLDSLKNGEPIIVENVDYGGHYKVIIGLDKVSVKPEEDILIFADPYDRNDGKEDGYNYFPAERFFYMWFDDHCLEPELRVQPFVIIKRKNTF